MALSHGLLLFWLFSTTTEAALKNSRFVAAKFVGNKTATSLAFAGDIVQVIRGNLVGGCASVCSKKGDASCSSFNFVKREDPLMESRCELINATMWPPSSFQSRPHERSSFYINEKYKEQSFFTIIPAVEFGPSDANTFPWNTDCMNQGGMAGLMVAMRNDRQDSLYTKDVKCRIFRHSFAMSQEKLKVDWFAPGCNMKCPDGYVITAMHDADVSFSSANTVRCNKPALPWKVNNLDCTTIDIYRQSSLSAASPYNDPGLSGTADSIWGAQCGTPTRVEALVAVGLAPADFKYASMQCCLLYVS